MSRIAGQSPSTIERRDVMCPPPVLKFMELTAGLVTDQTALDLNYLLPQLLARSTDLTPEWVIDLLHTGTRVFVAMDGPRIVASVRLRRKLGWTGRQDWIERVVVDQDYRRLHIASRLMDLAEQASERSGAKSIKLVANENRYEARKMYAERGYEPIGARGFRKALRPMPRTASVRRVGRISLAWRSG